MKRFPFLFLLGVSFFSASPIVGRTEAQPHVVLVMADDQGWGDVGYNGHPCVETPHLDAMAAAGVVLERFMQGRRCDLRPGPA